ncbi:MAG: aminotransferase class I/II-fold pyridoxal phosphate-dependent enzyme, partial [Clostridia bacterium]|nr:aminotransferase class I/II-fold pyridoxal phosphate-dependent enzyme [Clostridia bacterium]
MIKLSENFNKLKKNYLFAEIARRTEEYKTKDPSADVIKLGIGDVTLPLCKSVLDAMHEAVDEMGNAATFKGYGPYEGYEFLRKAISDSYSKFGIDIKPDEIYVSDGAKSDTANILEIFESDGNVLIP